MEFEKARDDHFLSQEGKCLICRMKETCKFKGVVRRLSVDHCHESGRVRGLLCMNCNIAIGKMRDDPNLLREAAMYLESS